MRCETCRDSAVSEKLPQTMAEAKKLGAKQYRTGKPCSHGHVGPRWTTNGNCVECLAATVPDRSHRYYYAHRERNLRAAKNWRLRNLDAIKEANRQRYLQNREAYAAKGKIWRQRNQAVILRARRRYAKENHDAIIQKKRDYHASPAGRAQAIAATNRRLARQAEIPGKHTKADIEKLVAKTKRRHLCGGRFTSRRPPTVDHVIAVRHELGSNDPGNLALAHRDCNLSKRDKRLNPITGQGFLL